MQRIAHPSKSPMARAVAAFALVAVVGAAAPLYAADVSTSAAPSASTAPAATSAADKHVEARIKDLHARLDITPGQEDAWGKVAQAMRDNANSMASLTQTRAANASSMTAVDDLKSYAEIAQAHADGLSKFTPVFSSLYDSMSDQQKLNADSIFRAHGLKAMKRLGKSG